MPSSFTPFLRIELQAAGENRTSWGARGNRSFERIDDGIAGAAQITMANQDYVLSTNYGTPDEARMVNLIVGGSLTQNRNLFIPPSPKSYNIKNDTSGGFAIIVNNGVGGTLAIRNGDQVSIYTDGFNIFTDTDVEDYVHVVSPGAPIVWHGYQRFRSGYTIQWARLNLVGVVGSYSNIPYPKTFRSTADMFVTLIGGRNTSLSAYTTSTYTVRNYIRNSFPGGGNGGTFTTRVYMMAIGIT